MFLICTFAGLAAGPCLGFIGGFWADLNTAEQNKLLGGVLGWTFSALVGLIIGAIITCNYIDGSGGVFNFAGLSIHGTIWTAWVASLTGLVVGVYTATVLKKKPN